MKSKRNNDNITEILLKNRLEKDNQNITTTRKTINKTKPSSKKKNNLNFDEKSKKKIIAGVLITLSVLIIILSIVLAKSNPNDKKKVKTKETNKSSQSVEQTKKTEPTTEEKYEIKSSIIVQGKRAMEIYSVSKVSLERYADYINDFSSKVPGVNVYSMLAPTSVAFYGPSKYRTGAHSQEKGIQIAYDKMNSNIKKISVYQNIDKHKDEYLYFRTDHHWTARGAYYAYEVFAPVAGVQAAPLSKHQTGKLDGFVGSYYRYTKDETLQKNPDYVEYFKPVTNTTATVYSGPEMSGGYNIDVINSSVTASNKYLAFIGGDHAVLKIKTDAPGGRKIVLIKESYGNAFAPFLCDNFSEVYVLDPRRFDGKLSDFVKKNGITDVLFLNYTFATSNPTYLKGLTKMLS